LAGLDLVLPPALQGTGRVLFELAFEGSGCACALVEARDGGGRLVRFAGPLLQRGARLQLLLCDAQEGPGKFDAASALGLPLARLSGGLGPLASGQVAELLG
jgi:hypothetical protein